MERSVVELLLKDKYNIETEIYRTNMSTIYRAISKKTGEQVAIKLPNPEDEVNVERFLCEVRLISKLQGHPNVVRLLDEGKLDKYYFMVIEYHRGGNLAHRISTGRIYFKQGLELSLQICEAIKFLHENSIIHRDLKTANILLNEKSEAVLIDFGLGKDLTENSVTQYGLGMGSPGYVPPEQIDNLKDSDEISDIFSLGAVIYELITGQPPIDYRNNSLTEMRKIKENNQYPIPSSIRPEIPHELDEIVLRCLQTERGKRYQDVKELEIDLRRIHQNLINEEIKNGSRDEAEVQKINTYFVPAGTWQNVIYFLVFELLIFTALYFLIPEYKILVSIGLLVVFLLFFLFDQNRKIRLRGAFSGQFKGFRVPEIMEGTYYLPGIFRIENGEDKGQYFRIPSVMINGTLYCSFGREHIESELGKCHIEVEENHITISRMHINFICNWDNKGAHVWLQGKGINNTLVNGRELPVDQSMEIFSDDILEIYPFIFRYIRTKE